MHRIDRETGSRVDLQHLWFPLLMRGEKNLPSLYPPAVRILSHRGYHLKHPLHLDVEGVLS